MRNAMRKLVTLHTRSPMHVGCGTSVDVIDLPINREKITGFPSIPATSIKGVLRDEARNRLDEEKTCIVFGDDTKDGSKHAGATSVMEGKLLAFPVRSLCGLFAWVTCRTALERFSRDTGTKFEEIPDVAKDEAAAGAEVVVPEHKNIVLEEYTLKDSKKSQQKVADVLLGLSEDPVWRSSLSKRLVVIHDENFQHIVETCTEVVARNAINPVTRKTIDGALFYQENVPAETLFYTILTTGEARGGKTGDPKAMLGELFDTLKIAQFGGDETTGHGLCEIYVKDI